MPEFFSILKARIQALWTRRKLERDLQDEIQFHLAEKQSELEASGIPPAAARSRVHKHFGNPTSLQESCRDAWMFGSLENSLRDARYALRLLAKNPAFTTIAILTLALGIGANTAIFSITNSVLLQALPYPDPGQLYAVREVIQSGAERFPLTCVNAGNFLLWAPHAGSFTGMALLEPTTGNLDLGDQTIQIHGVRASAALFTILGIAPQVGRTFTTAEDRSGKATSVILTSPLWKDRFHSDPAIVGRTIRLNGFPVVVAGVLPSSLYFPKQNELYRNSIAGWTYPIQYFVNLGLVPGEMHPGMQMFNFAVMARLRPNVTPQRAAAELDPGEAEALRGDTSGAQLHTALVPLKTAIVGPAEQSLWMLTGGAALVLLLVCVNLAGMLIAKSAGRTREIAVRIALGASRLDILRQLLIEALLLSITGGILGVLAAWYGIRALAHAAPVEIPRLQTVGMDARVLFFTATISLGAGILFSLLPALRLTRRGSSETAGRTTTSGRSISRLHQALAASEIALCTVLLISALLLAQSLAHVLKVNAWANVSHVVTIGFNAPPNHYQDDVKRMQLYTRLLDEAARYPGMEAVGISTALPLKGQMWGDDVQFQEAPRPPKETPNADWRFISPDYFRAIGLPLLSGRSLSSSDFGKHRVLISGGLAKQLPLGMHPVGVHILWTPRGSHQPISYEVIGVVSDVRARPAEAAPFMVYMPYWEWPPWQVALIARTAQDPQSALAGLQNLIRRTDREIATPQGETLRDVLNQAVAPRKFVSFLALLFAASATLLGALGLYGLISLSASQRIREIGIRIAVGARTTQIFRMMMSQAVRLSIIGLACGLAGAWAATRLLRAYLYEVKAADPLTFLSVCAGLLAVSLAASYAPARGATKVDPVTALKWE